MSALLEEPRPSARACGYVRTAVLGGKGAASFCRWVACGSVVVVQPSHRWALKAAMYP